MGGISIWQLAIVGILLILLFGRGKISDVMGDVAKGIKSFKKGMKEDEAIETAGATAERNIASESGEPIDVTPQKDREGA